MSPHVGNPTMINLWVDGAGAWGFPHYLRGRGAPLVGLVEVRTYEQLRTLEPVAAEDVHIFGALDQLTAAGRHAAAGLYERIARVAPSSPRLNHPKHALTRYQLLRLFHAAGVNHFQVRRAWEAAHQARFPVFLREGPRHSGALTRLLHSRAELCRALVALVARGHRVRDLLIVEFSDASDPHGIFRKYSAFRVGDRIIARNLQFGEHWVVKGDSNQVCEERAHDEIVYLRTNPHRDWVRRMFDLAQLEYGRIDYGVSNGDFQVWEINTNPSLRNRRARPDTADSRRRNALLAPGRALFHAQFIEALAELAEAGRRTGRDERAAGRVAVAGRSMAPLVIHPARTMRFRLLTWLGELARRYRALGWLDASVRALAGGLLPRFRDRTP